MRGRHDANLHAHGPLAPDPHHLAVLHHAQQSHLGGERELANLVEKERAAVGLLEPALPPGRRASEGALLVAEELRVDQLRRNGAAVDATERPVRNGDCSWMARATISLPVPVSPNSSTGALLRETMRARAITAASPVSPPISCSSPDTGIAVDQVIRREAGP